MTLVNKLKKLGYRQYQDRKELFVKDIYEFYYIKINLTYDLKEIALKYVEYAFSGISNQDEIDNLQIAFNVMNSDLKEIEK